MAVQDRNIHRDAKALRKSVTVPALVPGAVDVDTPFFQIQPRYNYRVSDLSVYAGVVATAAATIKASVVGLLDAVGTPAAAAATAVTFTLEAFWQNVAGVMTSVAATAAQAFTGTETVTGGGWGVWLIQATAAGTITTKAPGATMGYATEADALRACPAPDALNGVVAILTLFTTVGNDFIAGTTNTDAAAVTSFNTSSRDGHAAALAINAGAQYANATQGQKLQDEAGSRILQGVGADAVGGGDLLVLTSRSAGTPVFTNAQATVEFRPFPAQGEGSQSMSNSMTGPQVP